MPGYLGFLSDCSSTPFPRRDYGGETYQRDLGRGVPRTHLLQQGGTVVPEQRSPGFHWFLLAPRQLERERGKTSLSKDLHGLKRVLAVGSGVKSTLLVTQEAARECTRGTSHSQ